MHWKAMFFFSNNTTLASYDPYTTDEKLKKDINRKEAKISALSSGKINKYEYLMGEEILSSEQNLMINKLSLLILL